MKALITILFIFNFATVAFSQTTEKAGKFLSDESVKLSIEEIKKSFSKSSENWIGDKDGGETSPFQASMKADVFSYFSLLEKYDSDLKKSMFKKTDEYKLLLDSLSKIKNSLLSETYYQISLNQVYEFSIEYDIQKKGFLVAIGNVLPYHCQVAFLPKVIGEIEFKQLNISKKYNLSSNSNNSYTQYLFFPMKEEEAIILENNKENVEYLLVFNIEGLQTSRFSDQDFIKDNQQNCKVEVAKGGDLRFIIFNEKTNLIYLDKLFRKISEKGGSKKG